MEHIIAYRLQDIVTTLRRKILAMEQSTQAEVKRLTSEVIKLHRNIKDIQLKAQHFCSVNASKYFQLWKFNHDSAQKLCDKVWPRFINYNLVRFRK